MLLSQTSEQAFECLIEKALVGSTMEERKAAGNDDIDAQHPGADQYYWGRPKDMPSKLAIDTRRLWSFLESSQKDVLAEYRGKDLKAAVERQISSDITNFGIIKLLREGIDVDNIHLTLFFPKPSPADSKASHAKYARNQFSVTRRRSAKDKTGTPVQPPVNEQDFPYIRVYAHTPFIRVPLTKNKLTIITKIK